MSCVDYLTIKFNSNVWEIKYEIFTSIIHHCWLLVIIILSLFINGLFQPQMTRTMPLQLVLFCWPVHTLVGWAVMCSRPNYQWMCTLQNHTNAAGPGGSHYKLYHMPTLLIVMLCALCNQPRFMIRITTRSWLIMFWTQTNNTVLGSTHRSELTYKVKVIEYYLRHNLVLSNRIM